MEAKEDAKSKGKIANYARWIVGVFFTLMILLTIFMAAYRKFGG